MSNNNDIQRARALRKESTLAERLLWNTLRSAVKNEGISFRRQHPISSYIVDFVCLKAKLIIEIDGPSHDSRCLYDKKRESHLNNLGYKVLRFTNNDVYKNCEGVATTILNQANKQINK